MKIQTTGIHHIGLRCMDIDRTRIFYRDVLGMELLMDTETIISFNIGRTFIAFKKAEPRSTRGTIFSPFEVGLDHVALICEREEDLHHFSKGLDEAGVENTGVRRDSASNKLYVAFKDPDRIQWEFYMQ
jgi:glyoxylase I family protein